MQESSNVKSSQCFSQGLPSLPGEAGPTGLDGRQVGIAKQEEKNDSKANRNSTIAILNHFY